jgi:TPP-dependent pyruvate/acetoin dehydrogenase alpha subunit
MTPKATTPQAMTPDEHVALLRLMILSRVLERTCCELNPRWFPAEGEEAAIAGTFFGLRDDDVIAPHYRGPFAAYYARGADLARLIGQALGKANGYAKGRALGFTGPADRHVVPWVAGDLGTSLGVATGTALGLQYEGSDRVAVVSFGDGTSNRGDFHEALNLAAVWKLPIIYVCQHNQYSISLHASRVLACGTIASRAAGYGMPGETVDGNDVLAVHEAVHAAVARARGGVGPSLVEACPSRLGALWAADPGGYRTEEEVAAWHARDPIPRYEQQLLKDDVLTTDTLADLWQNVRDEVAAAAAAAQAAPPADPADMGLDEVYA